MATENPDKAVLHYPGGEYEMDIMQASEGNDGVVLGKMLGETGLVTFDPGLRVAGVILNKVGSERHAREVRTACEDHGVRTSRCSRRPVARTR